MSRSFHGIKLKKIKLNFSCKVFLRFYGNNHFEIRRKSPFTAPSGVVVYYRAKTMDQVQFKFLRTL